LTTRLYEETNARSKEGVQLQIQNEQLKASESNLKQERERLRDELDRYIISLFHFFPSYPLGKIAEKQSVGVYF